jgi:transcriptional regulator with XRE-family HTH domain
MTLTIGNKIKELRKQKRITQEQLADSIGISFQAVSKWENNIALPDITLVPALANYFNVNIDELFDYKLKEQQAKVKAICDEAYPYRETDSNKAKLILENGLTEYPDNDIILNNLLYVLNYTENPDETIRIASKLISETNDNEVKYDALRFLAYAYSAKGEDESAKSAIDQIPELYFSKLSEVAFIMKGEAKYEAAEKQKWISFEMLLQMMWKIAECYEVDGKTDLAITETKRALGLINTMCGEGKIKNFLSYVDYFAKQIDRMNK